MKNFTALAILFSTTVFANCNVFIEGQGFNDDDKVGIGGLIPSDDLPKRYKFNPKKMLVKTLTKKGYQITENHADARFEINWYGGKCHNQFVVLECDLAIGEINMYDNIYTSNFLEIRTEEEGYFSLLGYMVNPSLAISTSGKSAYKNALDQIPVADCKK